MRIWAALHRTKFNKISPFPNEGLDYQTSHNASNSTKKSFIDSFLNLFNEDYPLKWDFCKQSSNEMIHFLEIGIQKYKNNEKDVPLVMIGHSKDFFNRRAFEIFLKYCSNKYSKHIKFSSFQDFVDRNIA